MHAVTPKCTHFSGGKRLPRDPGRSLGNLRSLSELLQQPCCAVASRQRPAAEPMRSTGVDWRRHAGQHTRTSAVKQTLRPVAASLLYPVSSSWRDVIYCGLCRCQAARPARACALCLCLCCAKCVLSRAATVWVLSFDALKSAQQVPGA